jgi:hypothetical protein
MAQSTARIRQCAECPKCRTRYLVAFSPYDNGSYLLPVVAGSWQEYILHCSCGKPPACSRWHWDDFKTYAVSRAAYDRGYGTPDEVVKFNDEAATRHSLRQYEPNRPA